MIDDIRITTTADGKQQIKVRRCHWEHNICGSELVFGEWELVEVSTPETPSEKQGGLPAELRECYVVVHGTLDPFGSAYANRTLAERSGKTVFAYREVPSAERVREALDAFAIQGGYEDWSEYKTGIPGLSNRILAILRSLGIDTEGL